MCKDLSEQVQPELQWKQKETGVSKEPPLTQRVDQAAKKEWSPKAGVQVELQQYGQEGVSSI